MCTYKGISSHFIHCKKTDGAAGRSAAEAEERAKQARERYRKSDKGRLTKRRAAWKKEFMEGKPAPTEADVAAADPFASALRDPNLPFRLPQPPSMYPPEGINLLREAARNATEAHPRVDRDWFRDIFERILDEYDADPDCANADLWADVRKSLNKAYRDHKTNGVKYPRKEIQEALVGPPTLKQLRDAWEQDKEEFLQKKTEMYLEQKKKREEMEALKARKVGSRRTYTPGVDGTTPATRKPPPPGASQVDPKPDAGALRGSNPPSKEVRVQKRRPDNPIGLAGPGAYLDEEEAKDEEVARPRRKRMPPPSWQETDEEASNDDLDRKPAARPSKKKSSRVTRDDPSDAVMRDAIAHAEEAQREAMEAKRAAEEAKKKAEEARRKVLFIAKGLQKKKMEIHQQEEELKRRQAMVAARERNIKQENDEGVQNALLECSQATSQLFDEDEEGDEEDDDGDEDDDDDDSSMTPRMS